MRGSIVLITLLWAGAATGAAGEPVVQWENGKPVTIEQVREKNQKEKRPWADCWAWVAYEGFRPLQQPRKDAQPAGAEALPFLKRVNRLYTYQFDDTYYLMATGKIGTGSFQLLGWVPRTYVVRENLALQDDATTLLQKAMIVNSVRYVKEAKEVAPPAMLTAPRPDGKAAETFRLFNIYFIYGDTDPRDEENGYLLLGSKTQFNFSTALTDDEEPRRAIHGWVDKRRLCRWRTREALMWDPDPTRKVPVVTYEEEEEALKAVSGKPARAVTSENLPNGKPAPWAHARMRYPVVAMGKKDAAGRELLSFPAGSNSLRRIGLVGDFVNEKGEREADRGELEQLQAKLANLKKEVKDLELLFVVDDSTSMHHWFPKTAQAIQELIDLVKEDGRNLRIARTFYSDVPDDERGSPEKLRAAIISSGELADAGSSKVQEILKDLPGHATRKGYDPREQMYLGLRLGIEEASFSPFARKLVILIGDTGDHDLNADGMFRAEQEIVRRLTPKDQSPIEFYALQVARPDEPDERAFKDQATKIVQLFRAKTENRPSGYFQIGDKEQLRQVILARFAELHKQAKETENLIHRISLGQLELIDKLAPEFVKALDIPPERLESFKKSKGAQLFSYAYVWENNPGGQRQTRRQLLLSKRELLDLHKLLGDFFGDPDAVRVPTPQRLADFIANYQAGQGKEERSNPTGCVAATPEAVVIGAPREQKFETLLKVKYGFNFRSKLLQMTADELEKRQPTDREYLAWEVKKRWYLMDDILNKRKYQYDKLSPEDTVLLKRLQEIQAARPGEFDRSFTLHDDSRAAAWYWLDYDEEWP